MTRRDTKSAGKATAKTGRLKLKKETVRDLNVGESAKNVRGGGIKSNFCTEPTVRPCP